MEIKAGPYAYYMLNFSPKIRLDMLINVMFINKKKRVLLCNAKLHLHVRLFAFHFIVIN